ncbi:ADP-ribosylglycohydrolase family protein [Accumulibacter sp.]|uniref:ADP-ribosylglycohydrolase family protein n=1 Tax=Accumulibacter sp. TaxID=2053492 RepID=UPI0025E8BE8D|nr:ADP-ribosylglycohydrolase family protein [Accumulibacter sp.]MCM8595719.1 ADP-ribosylglycohydrolase family protein [Accumulibacter sp.]MCM8627506.1 ADP-ribosylglycohydrolase family protein [Accumulibacter sp.]MDS4049866.1 ADP-ribosylglycohydrolase family protein [Accumulibacter sp.]
MSIEEAAVGCLLGTAVGDALGLPCEGLSARRQKRWCPTLEGYRMLFGKGLCSDDTEHSCLLAQAILASGGDEWVFEEDLARRLRWWLAGLPAGIGFATLRALLKLWLFLPRRFRGVRSAGNGPAMRSALLGVCFADDEARMLRLVQASTRLTHTDPRAECGALAVALAARCSMRGETFDALVDDLARLGARNASPALELVGLLQALRASVVRGEPTDSFMRRLGCTNGVSGYIYRSVPAALHAWQSHPRDFAAAVSAVIRCGGDTDTTGAIVGGIVGAGVGSKCIPDRWLDDLVEWPRTVEWIEDLARKAARAAHNGATDSHPVSVAGLMARNALFLVLVLAHGFRRLLPPY